MSLVVQLRHAAATSSMRVAHCPEGRSLEAGLCYRRCSLGWTGLACTCWKGGRATWRGCGVAPSICTATSFRVARLAPPAPRGPFTLALSADPQLFRNNSHWRSIPLAQQNNRALVASVTRVTELGGWPAAAGRGAVGTPAALVVLGDLTEGYAEQELDAFRHYHDPSFPGNSAERVRLATWLMLGNHDYINNLNRCGGKSLDQDTCSKEAVSMMRSALAPGCDSSHWTGLPKRAVSSFDVASMAYAFDYGLYHFISLQHSPKYQEPRLGVRHSMDWLAQELSHATAQGRRPVLLVHAHKDFGLTTDPTFPALLRTAGVAALFYGHVHTRPWGYAGSFAGTSVPTFNCGASWFQVYCLAEFSDSGFKVGAVRYAADATPEWYGSASFQLQARAPVVVLDAEGNPNPNVSHAL